MHIPTTYPTDLNAPGAIEQLLAAHRSVFGTLRMEADGDGGDSGDQGQDGDAATPGSDTPKAGAPTIEWDGKIESLPADAQKIIADLRKENGDARVKAKGAEDAATKAQQDLVQSIGKALGLVTDEDADKVDADKLTTQLTAAQDAQRQAQVELAVYRTASTHQGDPAALLDSRAFLAKVAGLDPTADDFGTKVDEAIKSAVADNPKLKAARAAGQSSVDLPGGSGEGQRKPADLASAIAQHYGT